MCSAASVSGRGLYRYPSEQVVQDTEAVFITSSDGRFNVQIPVEQALRVLLGFDLNQPVVVVAIGGANPLEIVGLVVHVLAAGRIRCHRPVELLSQREILSSCPDSTVE